MTNVTIQRSNSSFLKLALTPVIALTLFTACSSDGNETPPVTDSTQTTKPQDTKEPSLYGPDALFLSEYVRLDPGKFTEIDGSSFLFESAGTSSQVFALPAIRPATERLDLIIFCDAESKYDLTLAADGKGVDRTWGDRCSTSGMTIYTTAPFTKNYQELTLEVTVDDGITYRVSVLER